MARSPMDGQSQTGGTLLTVEDLAVSFSTPYGTVRAVDGVSLQVQRGRALGLVGESGSGKTVLARSIMRLLPRRGVDTTGRVFLDGIDLTVRSPKQMRAVWGSRLSMVFQDPMTSLNPVLKIGQQVAESLRQHRQMSRHDSRELAIKLLDAVGIPEPAQILGRYPHSLSGGMRQRVTIAIALSCDPVLLMADEPTTALDVTVQDQILDLLQEQQHARDMGMVLITHDLGVVANRTDDIAVMYAGQIVEQGPTPVVFAHTKSPYTSALLQSVPRIDNPPHSRLEVIRGRPPSLLNPPSGCRFAPRCLRAQERCSAELPPLTPGPEPGHLFRCWYPVDAPSVPLESSTTRSA